MCARCGVNPKLFFHLFSLFSFLRAYEKCVRVADLCCVSLSSWNVNWKKCELKQLHAQHKILCFNQTALNTSMAKGSIFFLTFSSCNGNQTLCSRFDHTLRRNNFFELRHFHCTFYTLFTEHARLLHGYCDFWPIRIRTLLFQQKKLFYISVRFDCSFNKISALLKKKEGYEITWNDLKTVKMPAKFRQYQEGKEKQSPKWISNKRFPNRSSDNTKGNSARGTAFHKLSAR